jgi:hypothetical protein
MCGWTKLETDVSGIKIALRVAPEYPTPNFAPSWNALNRSWHDLWAGIVANGLLTTWRDDRSAPRRGW